MWASLKAAANRFFIRPKPTDAQDASSFNSCVEPVLNPEATDEAGLVPATSPPAANSSASGGGTKRKRGEEDQMLGGMSRTLREELNCPVCREIILPPILQCLNGHLLCEPCHKRLRTRPKKCPECRVDMNNAARCRAMEKAVASLLVPCSNTGCSQEMPYSDAEAHASMCEHKEPEPEPAESSSSESEDEGNLLMHDFLMRHMLMRALPSPGRAFPQRALPTEFAVLMNGHHPVHVVGVRRVVRRVQ